MIPNITLPETREPISLSEVKQRRYYMVDQAQQNAKNAMMREMDDFIECRMIRAPRRLKSRKNWDDRLRDIEKLMAIKIGQTNPT